MSEEASSISAELKTDETENSSKPQDAFVEERMDKNDPTKSPRRKMLKRCCTVKKEAVKGDRSDTDTTDTSPDEREESPRTRKRAKSKQKPTANIQPNIIEIDKITYIPKAGVTPSGEVEALVRMKTGEVENKSTVNDSHLKRDIYCLPIPSAKSIPVPNRKIRDLLAENGMKKTYIFKPSLKPTTIRQFISKLFQKAYNLSSQEELEFKYLAIVPETNELIDAEKKSFSSSAILSFTGPSCIYIRVQRPSEAGKSIDWENLMFREANLKSLEDKDYKNVMVCIMHRLSSGKHKNDATEMQKKMAENLISDYKLNDLHQLVYTGNRMDQLVLFAEVRRKEAFDKAHGAHLDVTTTFKILYKHYYWNKVFEWVIDKVKSCPGCIKANKGNFVTYIAVDKIVDDILSFGKDPVQRTARNNKQANSANVTIQRDKYTVTAPITVRTNGKVFRNVPMSQPIPFPVNIPEQVTPVAIKTETPDMDDGRIPISTLTPQQERKSQETNDDTSSEEDETHDEDLQDISKNERQHKELPHSHCQNLTSSMYDLQKKGMYCDFFITLLPSSYNKLSKPEVFKVHKVVLAALSQRVRKIVKTNIKIGGKVTSVGLCSAIEYVYTGRISQLMDLDYESVVQTSTAALALDIEINDYLRKHRADFVKAASKIVINQHLNANNSASAVTGQIGDKFTVSDGNKTMDFENSGIGCKNEPEEISDMPFAQPIPGAGKDISVGSEDGMN